MSGVHAVGVRADKQGDGEGPERGLSLAFVGSGDADNASSQSDCDSAVCGINVQMGLHRDGQRWNLPDDLVEERR